MNFLAPLALCLAAVAPGARYVIHLADGSVQRVVARPEEDSFAVRSGATWTVIPASQVLRATLERDVLARVRELDAASEPGDPARVEVAHFALREGLLDEALAEIDAVLARDPDQAAARAFVARAPLSLTLTGPAERSTEARLVLFGARAKPAFRELAATRLAAEPREAVLKELARDLHSASPNVRAFAAFALRRIDPAAQADALVRRSVVDPSERVRTEAARTLRDANDETLALRVAAGLELDDSQLRTAAAASLGEMGNAIALPALAARLAALQSGGHPGGTRGHLRVGSQVAYVKDFNPEIAQGASIADPIVDMVEDGTLLDVRVGGTSIVSAADQRRAVCRAMQRISGVDLPEDPARWLAWWAEQASPTPATGGPR
jgi:HEAT repeat protein